MGELQIFVFFMKTILTKLSAHRENQPATEPAI